MKKMSKKKAHLKGDAEGAKAPINKSGGGKRMSK